MIKVICVKEGHKELTYHKIYDAEPHRGFIPPFYRTFGWALIGDYGWVVCRDIYGWVIPLAEWRNQQIDKILNNEEN